MAIVPFEQCKSYELDRGVLFRDMQTHEQGTQILSVGTATFQPGRYLPCHRHNCEEVIVILEGHAFVDVAGTRTPMKKYDSSHVPEGAPHRFVNASKTDELTILWIYSVPDVRRLTTHYDECMGAAPAEPGEDGYVAVRAQPSAAPAASADERLVSEIASRVMAALQAGGTRKGK